MDLSSPFRGTGGLTHPIHPRFRILASSSNSFSQEKERFLITNPNCLFFHFNLRIIPGTKELMDLSSPFRGTGGWV